LVLFFINKKKKKKKILMLFGILSHIELIILFFLAWLQFLEHVQTVVQQRDEATAECRRLQDVVSRSHESAASSENKLAHARKLLDQERRLRKTAEAARESMVQSLFTSHQLTLFAIIASFSTHDICFL